MEKLKQHIAAACLIAQVFSYMLALAMQALRASMRSNCSYAIALYAQQLSKQQKAEKGACGIPLNLINCDDCALVDACYKQAK